MSDCRFEGCIAPKHKDARVHRCIAPFSHYEDSPRCHPWTPASPSVERTERVYGDASEYVEAMAESEAARARVPLTFDAYSVVSRTRAMRWHRGGLDEWSVTDWSNAMAGEAGELCNAVKKYRRVEDRLQGGDGDTPQPKDVEQAVRAIKKEIGDTYAYLDLLAQRFGLRVEDCVRDTFNQISEREGFPERLP